MVFMAMATVRSISSFDGKRLLRQSPLEIEGFNSEKYFISYQDKNKKRLSVAIENGTFYLLDGNRVRFISDDEVLRILLLIRNKVFTLNGHGHYSKSILI